MTVKLSHTTSIECSWKQTVPAVHSKVGLIEAMVVRVALEEEVFLVIQLPVVWIVESLSVFLVANQGAVLVEGGLASFYRV